MKFFMIIVLALVLLKLVRRNLLQVDLSFPLFVTLIVLGFLSTNETTLIWIADKFEIVYAPIAIILIAIAILLGLITILAIALSRIRYRQIMLIRYLAAEELDKQEKDRGRGKITGS